MEHGWNIYLFGQFSGNWSPKLQPGNTMKNSYIMGHGKKKKPMHRSPVKNIPVNGGGINVSVKASKTPS